MTCPAPRGFREAELVIDRLDRIQEQLDKITEFVQSNRIEIAKLQTKSAIFAAIAGIVGGALSSLGLNNFGGK